jgi:hypothetical protein
LEQKQEQQKYRILLGYSMSKYTEDLIDKAQSYWSQGKEIPLDLFTDMAMAGLDVVSLENNLKKYN